MAKDTVDVEFSIKVVDFVDGNVHFDVVAAIPGSGTLSTSHYEVKAEADDVYLDPDKYLHEMIEWERREQTVAACEAAAEILFTATIESPPVSPFLDHVLYDGCEWFETMDRGAMFLFDVLCSCGARFEGVSDTEVKKARALAHEAAVKRKALAEKETSR